MPPEKTQPKPVVPASKAPWFVLAAAVAVATGAIVYCFWKRPADVPVAPTAATPAPAVPMVTKHIYSEIADPKADLAVGLVEARREHKRVILDFGGDWCGDCQVLDIYFNQPPNEDLLEKNFVLVHVWVGHMDANVDVAAKYGVPINRGVPALAVLASDGKVLYSQATGEFADMRHMDPNSVTEFLKKWKS